MKLPVNAARKGPRPLKPSAGKPAPEQLPQPQPTLAVCLRCGAAGPVGEDGFCDRCEKALEQACL